MTLAELFPEEDYRFTLRLGRVEVSAFFAATKHHALLLGQRRHWLRAEPERYAALLPDGVPLLEEVSQLASAWNGFTAVNETASPWEQCLELGEFWEADYLLLKADAAGEIRLLGGCLCFPSSWRLADKLGKPIESIHAPVPGLGESIGPAIHKFLAGLKPGAAWLRHNWGLARSAEMNHHPDRNLPRLDAHVREEEIWLRVEQQALVALPVSEGILFGIRIENHPLAEVKADAVAQERLRRALKTMPEPMAVYKGIAAARERILEILAA